MKPIIVILVLLVAAAGLAISATYLLMGLAWAMLVGAAALLAFAALLARGMTPNG